jgi:hypothetical protein
MVAVVVAGVGGGGGGGRALGGTQCWPGGDGAGKHFRFRRESNPVLPSIVTELSGSSSHYCTWC